MKNKKTIAVISGAVGVCMLTTAAFAGYQTANGYDALKKSLLSTMDYTNCTISSLMSMEFDSEEIAKINVTYELAAEDHMSHTAQSVEVFGEEPSLTDSYLCDDAYYSRMDSSADGEAYYSSYPSHWSRPNLWGIETEDRATADKIIRFMELACDTVVGDLRNNFVCTEDEDESVSYSITLDSVQIPELINAGLSMVFSMNNNMTVYYTDEDGNSTPMEEDPYSPYYYTKLMGNDPILDSITMSYTVNKDGTFRDGSMTAEFAGNGHTMTFNVSGGISEIGTTSIASPQDLGFRIIDYSYDDYSYDAETNTMTIGEADGPSAVYVTTD